MEVTDSMTFWDLQDFFQGRAGAAVSPRAAKAAAPGLKPTGDEAAAVSPCHRSSSGIRTAASGQPRGPLEQIAGGWPEGHRSSSPPAIGIAAGPRAIRAVILQAAGAAIPGLLEQLASRCPSAATAVARLG
ncbi:hypothetical protein KIL84_007752 [Mauremys mutica]|uniref:Uncharacterized protein n=1 Tax=Mauremys mutica TaxID=74926 RepID=A0A9D3WY12_9SAUR|nr:hypothetical protein KIL84_007752 [Mauremys mutica]